MALVFVGINPSPYSVQCGHYFARRTSRFWPAFSRSRLSEPLRTALEVDVLGPENDGDLPRFGIGFTDVVKVPTNNVSGVTPAMYAEWTPRLYHRLSAAGPRLAVFHGVMGYRPFLRYGLREDRKAVALGPQPERIGTTHLYVIPNPSPANAHFTPADQTAWYDRVADYLSRLDQEPARPHHPAFPP